MIRSLLIERETNYVNLATGEVYETHAEAMEQYRTGVEIQVIYRTRYNHMDWGEWVDGPKWYH